jgi:hypothetical protein
MNTDELASVPCRVDVSETLQTRYGYGSVDRPLVWEERTEGIDTVRTVDGRTIRLRSDGQQSPPKPGWGLIISGGDATSGYTWTLYSLPRGAKVSSGPRF